MPVAIRSERLLLRDLRPDDLEAAFAFAGDPEAAKWSTWGAMTRDEARAWVAQAVAQNAPGRRIFDLGVEHEGRLVGTVFLGGVGPAELRTAEVGYTLHRDAWGRGFATEAVRAVSRFAFRDLGLHRLQATAAPENVASQRVLDKAGFQREGLLRQNVLQRGRWRDSVLFARLETDP